jgi:Gram-negative bacterial TonB protein C-terminal/Secretion system C-terminal sorting domain
MLHFLRTSFRAARARLLPVSNVLIQKINGVLIGSGLAVATQVLVFSPEGAPVEPALMPVEKSEILLENRALGRATPIRCGSGRCFLPMLVIAADTPVVDVLCFVKSKPTECGEIIEEPASSSCEMFEMDLLPQFPGGEKAFLCFLYENLQWPEQARDASVFGTVVASFVVKKDGAIADIKLLRDIGGGCGREAMRVIGMMPKWAPGSIKGMPVNCKMIVPVKFRLDWSSPCEKNEAVLQKHADIQSDTVYDVYYLSQPPSFPGGERGLQYFLAENLRLPKLTDENCRQGRVAVSFVINKDSTISDIKILRDIGAGFVEELIKVVRKMPKWIPGKLNNVTVNSRFVLPARFSVECPSKKDLPEAQPLTREAFQNIPAKLVDYQIHKTIDSLSLESLRVWPNPTDGPLNLEFTGKPGPLTVSVFDLAGRMLIRENLSNFDGFYQKAFDLSAFPPGMALIRMEQAGKTCTSQIVVK